MSPSEAQQAKLKADSDRIAARLWRAWITSKQMIKDRGYNISEEEIKISLNQFRAQKANASDGTMDFAQLRFSAQPGEALIERMKNLDGTVEEIGGIHVEFNNDDNVGIKQMRQFAQYLQGHNYHTGILITTVHITPSALKIIPAVANSVRIETFQDVDLLVNITHHELVPKHEVLSKTEKQALLKRYRLKETQLPRIQVADPVAKYLGLKRGMVVKIIRKSETAGRYASYRLAV